MTCPKCAGMMYYEVYDDAPAMACYLCSMRLPIRLVPPPISAERLAQQRYCRSCGMHPKTESNDLCATCQGVRVQNGRMMARAMREKRGGIR